VTFAGSAALQADSSYWVWIGDSSGATGVYSVDGLSQHRPHAVIANYDTPALVSNHIASAIAR